ncbi:MAG: type IV secretion system protein [Pseudomonadota bacterium]
MIQNRCTPADGSGLVAPLLEQVDCQVATYVETTYGAMFGPLGFLEPALTGALTLYIAVYGYQLILGRSGLSLSGLAPKVLLIGLVLAFATRWGAYQGLFLNIFYGGADQLAGLLLKNGEEGVFVRLDNVLRELIRIAGEWNNTAINRDALMAQPANGLPQPQLESPTLARSNGVVNLLWFSAILLALSTAGVLVIAKIVLGLLLALGPVLVVLALFAATRGLFEGWLKTLANYALVAAFAMALAGGVLLLVEPMVLTIAEARASGDANPQPVFVLAVTVFVFALLMVQILRMCARLTGSWRLPSASGEPSRSDAQILETRTDPVPTGNPRVSDIVVAVERAGGMTRDGRAQAAAQSVAAPASAASSYASRRTGQHYQSFANRLGARGRFA